MWCHCKHAYRSSPGSTFFTFFSKSTTSTFSYLVLYSCCILSQSIDHQLETSLSNLFLGQENINRPETVRWCTDLCLWWSRWRRVQPVCECSEDTKVIWCVLTVYWRKETTEQDLPFSLFCSTIIRAVLVFPKLAMPLGQNMHSLSLLFILSTLECVSLIHVAADTLRNTNKTLITLFTFLSGEQ